MTLKLYRNRDILSRPDEVFNREGHFVPTNTINNNNSGRNALIRLINGDNRFNLSLQGDEENLINYLIP